MQKLIQIVNYIKHNIQHFPRIVYKENIINLLANVYDLSCQAFS